MSDGTEERRLHVRSLAGRGIRPSFLAAARGFDRGDVDLLHLHHRFEGALRFVAADRQRVGEDAWRDLPGDAPAILAPPALALLTGVADDRVPVAVGLLLGVGRDLEREGLALL